MLAVHQKVILKSLTMTTKSETVTFRIRPDVKDALRQAAALEHRSLANMLEVMIRDWSDAHVSVRSTPYQASNRDSTDSAADD